MTIYQWAFAALLWGSAKSVDCKQCRPHLWDEVSSGSAAWEMSVLLLLAPAYLRIHSRFITTFQATRIWRLALGAYSASLSMIISTIRIYRRALTEFWRRWLITSARGSATMFTFRSAETAGLKNSATHTEHPHCVGADGILARCVVEFHTLGTFISPLYLFLKNISSDACLNMLPLLSGHIYTMLLVIVSWVIFPL